jgi:hypothetical protein
MMASFFAGTPLEARISLRKVKKSLAMSLAVGVALKKVLNPRAVRAGDSDVPVT